MDIFKQLKCEIFSCWNSVFLNTCKRALKLPANVIWVGMQHKRQNQWQEPHKQQNRCHFKWCDSFSNCFGIFGSNGGLSVSGFDLPFWLNWALQLVSVCNSWAAWYPVLSSLGRNSQKCGSVRCVWLVAAAQAACVQSVLGSSVHKPQLHTRECGSHWAVFGCFRLFRALWHIYWRRIRETENQKEKCLRLEMFYYVLCCLPQWFHSWSFSLARLCERQKTKTTNMQPQFWLFTSRVLWHSNWNM